MVNWIRARLPAYFLLTSSILAVIARQLYRQNKLNYYALQPASEIKIIMILTVGPGIFGIEDGERDREEY